MIDAQALAHVFVGETLVATSQRAVVDRSPEYLGRLLIPKADLASAWQRLAPSIVAEVAGPSGGLVELDAATVRTELTDMRPGWYGVEGNTCRFPRWGDQSDLVGLMDALPNGDLDFETPPYPAPPRNVVEAGQIMGGLIVAAARSVPDQQVISLHVTFSRPVAFDEALRHRLAIRRAGRTFSTVALDCEQGGKSVASGIALLDRGAPDLIRAQVASPDVPGPEDCPSHDFGLSGRHVRFVEGAYDADPDRVGPAELHCWIRYRERPGELCLRQALLAHFTGHLTIAAAMAPHAGIGEALAHDVLSTGILAITLTLHADPDPSDWTLFSNRATFAGGGLAQGEGQVFARSGQLLASYSVLAMIRRFDAGGGRGPLGRRM